MDLLLQHPDILDCILDIAPQICRSLVRVNKTLWSMLSERVRQQAYLELWDLHNTSIFNKSREWAQFNALYWLCKRQTARAALRIAGCKRSKRVRIHRYLFGFYTGRRDEWHRCTLTVTPYATGRGASLWVQSFDGSSADKPYVTRTFDRIFSLGALVQILNQKYWHSFYCVWGERWSFTDNQASRVLILGYED